MIDMYINNEFTSLNEISDIAKAIIMEKMVISDQNPIIHGKVIRRGGPVFRHLCIHRHHQVELERYCENS